MSGKNIVLCSDGTGNTAIKARGTNVFKLYEAVDIQGHKHDPTLKPQVAFYDDGVGTSKLAPLKLIGGAFGHGFEKNVKDLYKELVHVYEPGDHIYLFGFSRGAYTVRALSGFIQSCGILKNREGGNESLDQRIEKCWKDFREGAFEGRLKGDSRLSDQETDDAYETAIEFIGAWDTVGAVGMPFEELRKLVNWFYPMRFSELKPSRCVKRACHALSIDDDRLTFRPELWNEEDIPDSQQVKQVWFAGVHSNVGGGYVKHGMSLVALEWMMAEAEMSAKEDYDRLRFIKIDREYVHTHQDVHDKLYDARASLGVYYRWEPRNIAKLCEIHHMGLPKIHVSVFERIANNTDAYAPISIPDKVKVVGTNGTRPWPSKVLIDEINKQIAHDKKVEGGNLVDNNKLRKNQESHQSLLERMRVDVMLGKMSYYTFVAVSVLVIVSIYVLWRFPQIVNAFAQWCPYPFVVIGGIYACIGGLIWYWAYKVDKKMESTAKKHWQCYRKALRDLFMNGRMQRTSEAVDETTLAVVPELEKQDAHNLAGC